MSAPREIIDLIERFTRNAESYRSGHYGETQVRREFIDPFFKCLGWDIDNTLGFAEAYKDVIHEDAIKVGGVTKAPDYCFRVGGTRKFFLEAKRPSVNLKNDPEPAFQLRRYAWSARLPLSILTDFEEFAVYDCRIKPAQSDKAAAARIRYLTFTEYAEQWDSIAAAFSKTAVLQGSFDKYAESTKLKKGTATVDTAFLKEIEGWRELLAKNIALRNPDLSQRELNYAVQVTIDRILFLRMCEDRGIELYGQLAALQNGTAVYGRMRELFRKADERYNSGLFHFTKEANRSEAPDELTTALTIDDKPLKDILKSLYYPESPYAFSVLPAEILGQVYEQFLGKVIRLTSGHRAVVEEKPEVRKAGGVYYTPTYIVDYIVKNTVGKLLEGKTPRQAAKVKVLDPACGSGSFLLGAYQYLLDWHRDRYVEAGTTKATKELFQGRGGAWHLTSAEKKRILLNNIYGVDIDTQAVEVTKLSLLLKVLEGESQQTLECQLLLFHERALPDLGSNIKCGNSLIGPDFYVDYQPTLFDDEERYRLNVLDWKQAFPKIMKDGGFDIVIGNPPWGAQQSEVELEYLRKHNREIIVRMIDSFMYFVYQSTLRLKNTGSLGMILPDVLLYQSDNEKLRQFLLNGFRLHRILNMGDVFDRVTRPACVVIAERGNGTGNFIDIADLTEVPKAYKPLEIRNAVRYTTVAQAKISQLPGSVFVTSNVAHYVIWDKIRRSPNRPLRQLVDDDGIQRGVSPDLRDAFLLDRPTAAKRKIEAAKLRNVLTGGRQVKRYHIDRGDLLLIYTSRGDDFRKLPNIRKYIDQFKDRITCKEVAQEKHSMYALHRARDEQIFLKKQKLLGVITEDEIVLALDDRQTFATDGLYLFWFRNGVNPSYVMGILNSRLFVFVYRLLALESGRVLAQVKPTLLGQLPIRELNLSNKNDKQQHDSLVGLVDHIQILYTKLTTTKTPHDRKSLEMQIAATDQQIDKRVYGLYGLTADEIKIVEQDRNEPAYPRDADEETTVDENGDAATYTPYQPALEAGISEEMDRVNFRRIELAKRKSRGQLTPEEEAEFDHLQEAFFGYIETKFPGPPIADERLERLEQRYKTARKP